MKKASNKKTQRKKATSEEEIDKEIAESLKSSKEKIELDESELEEELTKGSDDDLEKVEFHESMRDLSSETKAPVLERIAGSAPKPIFVGTIPQGAQAGASSKNGGEDNGIKYVASNERKDEPKYVGSTEIYREPERVDFEKIGRERQGIPSNIRQEAFFKSSTEAMAESSQIERTRRIDRFEVENAGRHPDDREKREKADYRMKYKK